MDNYKSYDKVANMNKYSEIKQFEYQLKCEGSDIELDNIPIRCIINNEFNPYSETKEDRKLKVWLGQNVKKGSYVKYDLENYIVNSDIDKHGVYKDCKIRKCNQILKWKDKDSVIQEFPCISDNSAYGSKTVTNNDFLTSIDISLKVRIQNNEFTNKLDRGMRFIFEKNKYGIYKVTDIDVTVEVGLVVLTMKKDIQVAEDNLDDNIGFNDYGNVSTPPTDYTIQGDDTIRINETKEYKLEPFKTGILFKLDNEVCEIISQSDGVCNVKCLVKDEYCELLVMDGMEVLCNKTIETVR